MIEQDAIVIAVKGSQAEVEVQRQSACGGCEQSGGCSTSVLAKLFDRHGRLVPADNSIDARPGDHVVLGIEESALQIASLVAYLLPILGLLLGAMAGAMLGAEPLSVALGLLGLIAGLIWTRSIGAAVADNVRYRIRIVRNRSAPQLSVRAASLKT